MQNHRRIQVDDDFGEAHPFGETHPEPGSVVFDVGTHWVVPLRWPGMRAQNVIGLFSSLRTASKAASAIDASTCAVSAIAVLPKNVDDASMVVVGAHGDENDAIQDAAMRLSEQGSARLVRVGAREQHDLRGILDNLADRAITGAPSGVENRTPRVARLTTRRI